MTHSMIPLAMVLLLSPVAAEETNTDRTGSLERKLHGDWIGGPCQGELTVRADGTFERRHYSPGNHKLSGTWKIQWDALPPTLVLKCQASDDPERVGKTTEVKVVGLNNKALSYQYPKEKVVHYARLKGQTSSTTSGP